MTETVDLPPSGELDHEMSSPVIAGVISPEDARALGDLSPQQLDGSEPMDDHIRELRDQLAGDGERYALVVGKDERGEDTPRGYVSLGRESIGDTVRPENLHKRGLKDPTEAFATWKAAQEGPEKEANANAQASEPETTEAVPDEVPEAMGFAQAVQAVAEVRKQVAEDARVNIEGVRDVLYRIEGRGANQRENLDYLRTLLPDMLGKAAQLREVMTTGGQLTGVHLLQLEYLQQDVQLYRARRSELYAEAELGEQEGQTFQQGVATAATVLEEAGPRVRQTASEKITSPDVGDVNPTVEPVEGHDVTSSEEHKRAYEAEITTSEERISKVAQEVSPLVSATESLQGRLREMKGVVDNLPDGEALFSKVTSLCEKTLQIVHGGVIYVDSNELYQEFMGLEQELYAIEQHVAQGVATLDGSDAVLYETKTILEGIDWTSLLEVAGAKSN